MRLPRKNTCETRESFKQVSNEAYQTIRDQIYDLFGNSECFSISKEEPKSPYIIECLTVKDFVNKEQTHLDFYSSGTLYIRGFSWYIGEEILNIASKVTGTISCRKADLHNVMIHACHEDFILDDRSDCTVCQNGCRGNQEAFMRKIHYGDLDRYPCSRVADYYFTRYSYRYAYEFEGLLEKYIDILKAHHEWNMLSVGCGPCTDLLGALKLQEKHHKPIRYNGIDLNDCWNKIHELFMEKLSNHPVQMKIHHADIFEFIGRINPQKSHLKSNIISFQYVLSDMVKYHSDTEIMTFINRLFDEVFTHLPKDALIIFNDINSQQRVRPLLNTIKESFIRKKYVSDRWYYNSSRYNSQESGEAITNCIVQDEIPSYIEKKYKPWVRCKSTALVLRKEKS